MKMELPVLSILSMLVLFLETTAVLAYLPLNPPFSYNNNSRGEEPSPFPGGYVRVLREAPQGTEFRNKAVTRSARDLSEGLAKLSFIAYSVKAITNNKILPRACPIPDSLSSSMEVSACPGEYALASFCVYARESVKNLTVNVTRLLSDKAMIPSVAVDVRIVKCWYQAGVQVWETNQRLLVPELLLKDDSLIRVDLKTQQNYLRASDQSGKDKYILISGRDSDGMQHIQPRDTDELQAVEIPAAETRQFWVTVHVPKNAQPGHYEGRLRLIAADVPPVDLTLRVRVLPFVLEKPRLLYSIYYRGRLTTDGKGSISSEVKSPEQYEAEMRDLKDHGVEFPTLYQTYDEQLLSQVFSIRDKVGLPKGPLYAVGFKTGNARSPDGLADLRRSVSKWIKIAAQHGYDEVYAYGIDESKGELLTSQRAAWSNIHEAGAKVFAACSKGTFELMGDLLDVAVQSNQPLKAEARKYHNLAHKIFCYANPQVGPEEPETYRRNYGLLLWINEYDGAMNYAYQHSMGHCWNDFDHDRWRDHMFAYPTVTGVIDTVQWEGFREGVNDVRYLTTLSMAIERVRDRKPRVAAEAQKWVNEIDVSCDLDELRRVIIDWILRLQ